LIPAILGLLARAGLHIGDLDAIAFGRGPGAFTGLRTACSVAQGLAFGAGKPVVPVDTLLAVAEDARDGESPQEIWVAMDARMDEIYAARYRYDGSGWDTLAAPFLAQPDTLNALWAAEPPQAVAGSALGIFGERLQTGGARLAPDAAPHASGMLRLAARSFAQGGGVDAALAIPLYVRDKVAQTTAEREAARAARADALVADGASK
jgi:tRNA threonylcarbamoyladenosine biosynthesis protein TsaB